MTRATPTAWKWIGRLLAALIILLGVAFLAAMIYVDYFVGHDTFTEGSAYGFVVGATKKESFEHLQRHYSDRQISIVGNFIPGAPSSFSLDDVNAEGFLMDADLWYFHPDGERYLTFKIFFRDGKLIEIYRGWGEFEGF